jgi:hypothetical protein
MRLRLHLLSAFGQLHVRLFACNICILVLLAVQAGHVPFLTPYPCMAQRLALAVVELSYVGPQHNDAALLV